MSHDEITPTAARHEHSRVLKPRGDVGFLREDTDPSGARETTSDGCGNAVKRGPLMRLPRRFTPVFLIDRRPQENTKCTLREMRWLRLVTPINFIVYEESTRARALSAEKIMHLPQLWIYRNARIVK